VHIGLQPVDGGTRLQLQVSDDGTGLPAGFELGRTRSLGLQLVSDLARQLQGQLEMTSSGPGARFAVTFSMDHGSTAEADRL
jgi:two-component sensor histidine kinase